jgi:hypothetical protein
LFFVGGNSSDSDIVNIGDDTIDFILETEQENQFLPGKFYTWIKCNRDFQGFYVTEYSSESSSWKRFSSVLEAQPTVNFLGKFIFNLIFYFSSFFLMKIK